MKVTKLKATKSRKIAMLSMACGVSLFTGQAIADILFAATNPNPQSMPANLANGAFIDLSSAAGNQTAITFSTTAPNTRVVITFSSECIVGGGFNNYLDINLFLDPAGPTGATLVNPTAGNNTMYCSGAGYPNPLPPAGLEGFTSVIQGVAVIPTAGVHTVRVQMTSFGSNPAPTWRIDDLSLVVEQ